MNADVKKYHNTYTFKMVLFSLFLVLLFIVLLWLCRNTDLFTPVFKNTQNNEFTVIIDPGHGGLTNTIH